MPSSSHSQMSQLLHAHSLAHAHAFSRAHIHSHTHPHTHTHSQAYTPTRAMAANADAAIPEGREPAAIVKKRRGRQPRQSLLTSNLRSAVARFTTAVGAPVLQPAGFRDFNGWLHTIAQPTYRSAWRSLCHAFILESSRVPARLVPTLKRDLVHDIINNVVKRKSHESAKLVSTNARRQSAIPPSGNTVMTIFESYLATVSPVAHSRTSSSSAANVGVSGGKAGVAGAPASATISANGMGTAASHGRHDKFHHAYSLLSHAYAPHSSSSTQLHHSSHHHQHGHHHHQHGHSRHAATNSNGTPTSSHNVSFASHSSKSSKSSSKSSGESIRAIGASSMDISALLIDDYSEPLSKKNSIHRHSSSSTKSKLPSLSQLDEQLRERSEKERKF